MSYDKKIFLFLGIVPDLFAEGDIVGKDYGLILKSYGRDRTNLKVAQV